MLGKVLRLMAVCAVVLTSGCATVFKGSSQVVNFNSEPEGATVIVDGTSMGVTPVALNLKKNRYKSVLIKKEGYTSISQPLQTSYDAVALINIIWDCSTTDLLTGNAYEYEPNTFHFKLAKAASDEHLK